MLSDISASRRKFLLTAVLALPTMGVFVNTLSAAEAAEMAAPDLKTYRPAFFSAEEWAFMLAACDRLIPADGRGPGALETNVPVFIDQQMHGDFGREIYLQGPFNTQAPKELGYQLPYTPQQIYQRGIKLTDAYCRQKYHKRFSELDAATQDVVLKALQDNDIHFADGGESALKASQFFGEMISDAKNGYLSDPMYGGNKGMKAWIAIGFPGARASFLEWVSQHNVKYPLGPVSLNGLRA
ncbi:gluconate 2-dehydrogenase subunit 3 family protein [Paraburkholderia tropica]|uniref:gluconate 2-dehydrogenase subunit 3 family protein n=1 Tax=Paraburkholderia tropica TaxID=92647 RepID=UPI0007EC6603|nr:gluconate 2-dehydrogenase subunit 3 family protein [Paraburkholderia tropica]MBB2979688.1 gluconate 2-dehydrogenase gamma chain [Paraburkholderia tropica]MBB3000712.1 gluconate 2-dehydrogenase gamma chain [Paraburkholderia tropica]MBB6320342.1 gluconate 2-dehydrogenase gamma chain [Paraburkholderia tropica]OBR49122.1 gluconate 2-dehydrogenase [Paraburkholderia tropica]